MKLSLKYDLVLGSQSPRREMILKMLGITFEIFAPDIDERNISRNIAPQQIPEFLARKKSRVISGKIKNKLVLGFDTGVFLGDSILGKPTDAKDALKMLRMLNGRYHKVITGVSLARNGRIIKSAKESTTVKFIRGEDHLLIKYSNSREPRDKAGSYAIQGQGSVLIEKIHGCYYNVVGVPVQKTIQLLRPYLN